MCDIVESICGYEGIAMVLDRAMVDRVCDLYFTQLQALAGRSEGWEPPVSIEPAGPGSLRAVGF